jgi:arsenate reductase
MTNRDVPLEHDISLRDSVKELTEEFAGTFSHETVEELVYTSYDRLRGSRVPAFLPLFAWRFARQQLTAADRLQGMTEHPTPAVLFLCVHNAGRSQMAIGFMHHLAGDRVIAWSGGSEPASAVNPAAVEAMREVGIDISGEFPKPWTDDVVRAADVVVTMGCGDACPVYPGKRYEDWELDDPAGKHVAAVRPIRDEIERRVRGLLEELDVPSAH